MCTRAHTMRKLKRRKVENKRKNIHANVCIISNNINIKRANLNDGLLKKVTASSYNEDLVQSFGEFSCSNEKFLIIDIAVKVTYSFA